MNYKGPFVYPTVDVAVFDINKTKILMCRKFGVSAFQFIGGFADVSSLSYEDDAIREVKEEAGIDIEDVKYIGSCIVDDERYRDKPDKIKTLLFRAIHSGGIPIAHDDIVEVKWISIDKLKESDIVEKHRPLLRMLP